MAFVSDTDLAATGPSQGANMVGFKQAHAAAMARTAMDKIREALSVNDFGAIGDGLTDDTVAIQAAINAAAIQGGAEVIFAPTGEAYRCAGTLYVPSNVSINLNHQTLLGAIGASLFKTAYLTGGILEPIASFDENGERTVVNAQIHSGRIVGSDIAFDLQTWIMGCTVHDIKLEGCKQAFVLRDCFYSIWRNITATGAQDINFPTYHLAAASNAMLFERVTATTEFGWLIEGGATASTWIGCTFEGGQIGFKFKGPADAMGLAFIGCYFEFVPGKLFDFSEAAMVWINWEANYFNYICTVIDDGGDKGAASTSTLFGHMAASNKFANIGNSSRGVLYPGTMKVSGTRNFIQFDGEAAADVNLAPPPNWVVGKHTRRTQLRYWSADGVVDIRAVATQEAGITPRHYGGDVGSPYPGTIPFSTIALPSGASVTATITTQIKMQPNASVVHFVVAIADNVGPKKVAGTIYGEFVDQRQGEDRPVSVSTNSEGFLVLSIADINNGNAASFLTGSVFQQ